MTPPEERYPMLAAHAATDPESARLLRLHTKFDKALAGTNQDTAQIELPLWGARDISKTSLERSRPGRATDPSHEMPRSRRQEYIMNPSVFQQWVDRAEKAIGE